MLKRESNEEPKKIIEPLIITPVANGYLVEPAVSHDHRGDRARMFIDQNERHVFSSVDALSDWISDNF